MSTQEYNTEQEAVTAFPVLCIAIVAITITAVHCYKFYQDFFTKERVSVSHRREKPVKDWTYRKSSYLTLATLVCYSWCIVTSALVKSTTTAACGWIVPTTGVFALFAAKAGLYLTYVFRLHQVYGPSVYGYSPKKLVWVAATIVITTVILFALTVYASVSAAIYHSDTDNQFPYHCSVEFTAPWKNIIGLSMVLYEIVASVAAIIGFTRPLKRVVHAMEHTMASKDALDAACKEAKRRNEKILYSGYKYKVLVVTASVTTFLWIFLFLAGVYVVGSVVMVLDYVINPICILLMTSYYPSNLYYERLCYLCICCCDRNKESYQSKAKVASPRISVTGVKSLDTSRAVAPRDSVKSENVASQSTPDDVTSDVQLTVDLSHQTSAADPQNKEEDNVRPQ